MLGGVSDNSKRHHPCACACMRACLCSRRVSLDLCCGFCCEHISAFLLQVNVMAWSERATHKHIGLVRIPVSAIPSSSYSSSSVDGFKQPELIHKAWYALQTKEGEAIRSKSSVVALQVLIILQKKKTTPLMAHTPRSCIIGQATLHTSQSSTVGQSAHASSAMYDTSGHPQADTEAAKNREQLGISSFEGRNYSDFPDMSARFSTKEQCPDIDEKPVTSPQNRALSFPTNVQGGFPEGAAIAGGHPGFTQDVGKGELKLADLHLAIRSYVD